MGRRKQRAWDLAVCVCMAKGLWHRHDKKQNSKDRDSGDGGWKSIFFCCVFVVGEREIELLLLLSRTQEKEQANRDKDIDRKGGQLQWLCAYR